MARQIQILLQTTIPTNEDDWHIGRFSLLRDELASINDQDGTPLCKVTTRDREPNGNGDDPVLSRLDTTDFDELWLFAVDTGDGLSVSDCEGITRFRQRGGGLLTTRDHQDLGSSLCTLGGVGKAHYFHTRHLDPDTLKHARDDQDAKNISWPNYHSGSNGDYQLITASDPVHEVLRNQNNNGAIEYFPAHPHEGGIGVPEGETHARVIATGMSIATRHPFNLIVAFESMTDEHGNKLGRAIAESSFHHLCDYNWDTSKGCPSFVGEPPGNQIKEQPEKMAGVRAYVRNTVLWLSN